MARVIVWELADGSVAIESPNSRINSDDNVQLEALAQQSIRKDPRKAAAQRHFFITRAASDALYAAAATQSAATGKAARNAWRLNAAKNAVVIDATVLAGLPVLPTRAARDATVDAQVAFTAAQRTAIKAILNAAGTI
jgi:hypothetical protein